jgi:hypothetical protein
MHSVKSITPKIIKTLYCSTVTRQGFFMTILILLFTGFSPVSGQDNSPYSRYGIGDLVPGTHINTRGMAGISAGYIDLQSINFNNPASYSNFEGNKELRSKKLSSGRTILDIGINLESRTLREDNPAKKFTANNFLFSYVQVGVPLKKNWGLSFGLRPVSRVSYKIFKAERLIDPLSGQPIDSVTTRFEGDGGAYLASIGTGIKVFKKVSHNGLEESLSLGINAGYMFGKRFSSNRREFRNDSVQYFTGNFETRTNYGNINFNAGLQYIKPLKGKNMVFIAGIYGAWSQKLNATQDRIRETSVYDENRGDLRLDSVEEVKDIKGKIILPSTITAGFTLQRFPDYKKKGGWLIGLDINSQNWESYRIYGQSDSVRNKFEVRVGGHIIPIPRDSYFSNVTYRWGFFTGPDYINVQNKLPSYGVTMGFGLPIRNFNRLSPNQSSGINLAFEYIKRGNSQNLVRENLFRVSAGFSLSDIWFIKRKYD